MDWAYVWFLRAVSNQERVISGGNEKLGSSYGNLRVISQFEIAIIKGL